MREFQADYRPLSQAYSGWGAVALLPWDETIFGFPVAELEIGPEPPQPQTVPLFIDALMEFCRQTKAELISARASGTNTQAIAWLSKAGFSAVDFSLLAKLPRLKPDKLPKARFSIRRAIPEDHEAIRHLAGKAFQFGRYHTDPRFPVDLAHRRYVQWINRALTGPDPTNVVFVLGQPGEVIGFMHVVIEDRHTDLRLGAVDPGNRLGFAGFALYAETLRAVQECGGRSVSAKVAATNTRVMNILAALGFQFSCPEVTLHWHSPDAVHLS
jgi:ribosomal protein S18 acetylase RimI-like enzyme